MATEHTAQKPQEAGASEPGETNLPAKPVQPGLKPGGIGTGVAFDWALAMQLLTDGVCYLLAFGPGSSMAGSSFLVRVAAGLFTFLAAALVFTQGEALRRGRRVARIIQIIANSLLILLGLSNLPGLISSLAKGQVIGNLGSLFVEVVLLVVSPLIVWLLTCKRTRDWFATVTSTEARARHGGRWLFWMVLYAVIGGLAVAFASYY